MKEKILRKETVEVTADQETICQNINNLSGSLSSLSDIDSTLLDDELDQKLKEAKENILYSINYLSKQLTTEDPV